MTEQALEIIKEGNPGTLMRWATDVAGVSREIVLKTAVLIQGRKYVKVEGWQAIAVAHGCVTSSKDVEKVQGGYRAIGEVRRMADGVLLSQAEGFIGEDEPTWFGGDVRGKILPKRADYAIRAMCQTRAISRACRSAFAHVVVLIDGNLSTTPAEEVPFEGFVDVETVHKPAITNQRVSEQPPASKSPAQAKPAATTADIAPKAEPKHDWSAFPIPFGKNAGKAMGDIPKQTLWGFWKNFVVETTYNGKPKSAAQIEKDTTFRMFLDQAGIYYRFNEPASVQSSDSDMPPETDDVPF